MFHWEEFIVGDKAQLNIMADIDKATKDLVGDTVGRVVYKGQDLQGEFIYDLSFPITSRTALYISDLHNEDLLYRGGRNDKHFEPV